MKKLNHKKHGFSLAEAAVALAVISISSVGILSLVLNAQKSTIAAANKQQAQLYAADIIQCYRAGGDFESNVEFAIGQDWNGSDPIQLKGGLICHITKADPTLTVVVKNGEKELISQSFTKGGTPWNAS